LIRELLSYLPSNNVDDVPVVPTDDPPLRREPRLRTLVPENPKAPYDIKELIEAVVDNGHFLEVQKDFAQNLVIGYARLNGRFADRYRCQSAQSFGRLLGYQRVDEGRSICALLRCFQHSYCDLGRCSRVLAWYW
jgi:hypothetical protein